MLSVLFDSETSVFYGSQDADEVYCSLDAKERAKRKSPFVDKRIYTDWNCIVVSSFLKAGRILNNIRYEKIALNTLDFIIKNNLHSIAVHFTSSKVFLFRDDILLLNALLDAFEIANEDKFLSISKKLIDVIVKDFYDSELGGFFDILKSGEGELSQRRKNIIDNSVFCTAIMRFDNLAKKNHKKLIKRTLLFFNSSAKNHSLNSAKYAIAVDEFLKIINS